MWARICEVHLGAWLVLSPLVFRGTDRVEQFVWIVIASGTAVTALALLSFSRRFAWAHLVAFALAIGLALFGYFGYERPGPPAAENLITTALLLMLFTIVPNDASVPPPAWRERR